MPQRQRRLHVHNEVVQGLVRLKSRSPPALAPPQQLLHRPRPRQPPTRPPLEAAAPALPPLPAGQDLHVDELEVADLALAAAPPQSASVHTVIGRGGRVRNRGTVAYSMLEDLIYRKNCESA